MDNVQQQEEDDRAGQQADEEYHQWLDQLDQATLRLHLERQS
jgi:hypothetical protein